MTKPRKMTNVTPPVRSFTSPGGRRFTLRPGMCDGVWPGDPRRSISWRILYKRKDAGYLFRSAKYGLTADGQHRYTASTRSLYWRFADGAPTGIGFDVAAFDTAGAALAAWGRSADEILDWHEGKPVRSIYSKTGVFQKGRVNSKFGHVARASIPR